MYRKKGDVRRADQAFNQAISFSSTRRGLHLVTISLVSNTYLHDGDARSFFKKIFGGDFDGLDIDGQHPGGNPSPQDMP